MEAGVVGQREAESWTGPEIQGLEKLETKDPSLESEQGLLAQELTLQAPPPYSLSCFIWKA